SSQRSTDLEEMPVTCDNHFLQGRPVRLFEAPDDHLAWHPGPGHRRRAPGAPSSRPFGPPAAPAPRRRVISESARRPVGVWAPAAPARQTATVRRVVALLLLGGVLGLTAGACGSDGE